MAREILAYAWTLHFCMFPPTALFNRLAKFCRDGSTLHKTWGAYRRKDSKQQFAERNDQEFSRHTREVDTFETPKRHQVFVTKDISKPDTTKHSNPQFVARHMLTNSRGTTETQ